MFCKCHKQNVPVDSVRERPVPVWLEDLDASESAHRKPTGILKRRSVPVPGRQGVSGAASPGDNRGKALMPPPTF
jgi:hypothetical protein